MLQQEITIRSLPFFKKRESSATGASIKTYRNLLNNAKPNSRSQKRLVRSALIFGNFAIVALAILLVVSTSDGNSAHYSALSTAEEAKKSNPLDTLSANDVAVNISLMARLPESGLIINDADSVSAEANNTVSTHETIVKPQILSSDIKTKEDIKEYTVVDGDSLESLATKFGVTSDSIRWSNGLSNNKLKPGTVLLIPPVNGIVHTVKAGDTAETLASKYGVSKESITNFNDAEIKGLVQGERIVVPDGVIKAVRAATTSAPYYAGFAFGNSAIYGYNGYVPGYCTWYVANKRIAIGRPLPANLGNAGPWARSAPRAGFTVNHTPAAGAAIVTDLSNPGHVGFVEYVNPDGSVFMSEMNRRRRFEVTTRLLSPGEAARYTYIH